jgi:hypothetical protein
MAPTNVVIDQAQLLVKNGLPASQAIAITFGIITVLVTILGVFITWRHHLRNQNLPQQLDIETPLEMFANSGPSETTATEEGNAPSTEGCISARLGGNTQA